MDKSVKGIAIAAAAMVTVGILLAGVGFAAGGNQPVYFDKSGIHVGNEGKMSDGKMESFSKDLDSFDSINAELDFYDVDLIASDKYSIESVYSSKSGKPVFKIENGTLIVNETKHKGFTFDVDIFGWEPFSDDSQPSVKIYYPENAKLKDIKISCDSSDLEFENLTVEKAEFELDFGKLDLSDISANSIAVSMDSGDCNMENITADDLNLTNDFGTTTLNRGDIKTLEMKADSGDINVTEVTMDYGDLHLDLGKLTAKDITSKGLKVRANSGDIKLQGKILGITDINCDMGEVTIDTDVSKDQYSYELDADMGDVTIGGDGSSGNIVSSGSAQNKLKITTDAGDIKVNFN